jgi:exopolysaccharide production protein ExoQ
MSRWYYWASAFFLLQAMEAFTIVDRIIYGEWEAKPGDKITQGLNLLLIATSVVLISRGFRRTGRIDTGAVLALTAVTFLLLSDLWSIDPETTMRRSVVYLFVVIGAIGVSWNLDGDEFMDVLALTCGISAIASLLLLAVFPSQALAPESGDFRGIFSHKNVLGQAMAVGALASLHRLRVGGRKRLRNVVMLTLFTIVALASRSATSFMTIFAFCGANSFIALFRRGPAARIMAIGTVLLIVPVVVVAAAFPELLFELIGKDPTLTGRTELWAYVLTDIAEKPWLGWGYSAFWSHSNPAAVEISEVLKWYVPQAHNGILEMLLNVGLIGTALFVFLWARNVYLALRCLRTPQKDLAISSLLTCGGIFLIGISETVLIEPLQVFTSLFFITGSMCEQAVHAAGRRRYPAAVPLFVTRLSALLARRRIRRERMANHRDDLNIPFISSVVERSTLSPDRSAGWDGSSNL